MKRIIKNKVYDTETAKAKGEYTYEGYSESLYQKKTGEFFLYCSRGSTTPLTYDEAQAWAEEHLESDEYIKIFGEPDEGEGKSRLHIYLDDSVIAKLKAESSKQGITIGDLITNLMK